MASIISTRIHPILSERLTQLRLNLLAEEGGKPYITSRLQRFPSESDLSWRGDFTNSVVPRRDRAFLTNYISRVVARIVSTVYSQGVEREGIDPAFAVDATKTGETITRFWKSVGRKFIPGQWAWVQVDRGSPGIDPTTGLPAVRSIAQRKAEGDRIFFALWDSTEVKDWRFGPDGKPEWVLTEEVMLDNSDPFQEVQSATVRTLWGKGQGVRYGINASGEVTETPFELSADVCPFVPIGVPSAKPYWMDDLERLQASILNLDSAHHENLIKTVFPQLILPSGIISEIMAKSDRSFDDALELIRGIEYPLLETVESNGQTRFITPNASDLAAIPTEITRRRTELFELVGQNVSQETRMVASAESKAWDHEELGRSLADYAELFEEAELKAVALAVALDSTFPPYVPKYPRQFDLPNLDADTNVIERLEATGGLPPTMLRELAKSKVKILRRIVQIPDDTIRKAMAEIEDMDFADLAAIAAQPPPGLSDNGKAQGEDPGDDSGDDAGI